MGRIFKILLICLAVGILFCACSKKKIEPVVQTENTETVGTKNDENEAAQEKPGSENVIQENDDTTIESIPFEYSSYRENEEICIGDNGKTVITEGVLRETAYATVLDRGGWILGADEDQNILTMDKETFNIERTFPDGKKEILLENVLQDQENGIECVAWDGGKYVVWSESPFANKSYDETMGANWRVWLANLETKEMLCIDEDIGNRPDSDSAAVYLAPTRVEIADGLISYVSFAKNDNEEVVQSIMLYEIETGTLTQIGTLDGNSTENALGNPCIGNGYIAWSQAYIRPDALYEGYILLYNLAEGKTSRLETDENVLNPCIVGDFLVCEGNPNKTFYDSEIVIFYIPTQTMIRKVTAAYQSYEKISEDGVNLGKITSSGNYITWSGDILPEIIVYDLNGDQRFVIDSGRFDAPSVTLHKGNLLTWIERVIEPTGTITNSMHYCFLK